MIVSIIHVDSDDELSECCRVRVTHKTRRKTRQPQTQTKTPDQASQLTNTPPVHVTSPDTLNRSHTFTTENRHKRKPADSRMSKHHRRTHSSARKSRQIAAPPTPPPTNGQPTDACRRASCANDDDDGQQRDRQCHWQWCGGGDGGR